MARNLVVCSMLLSFFVIISTISPSFFQYFGKFDIAAIGPTTKEAIESRKVKVKILPDEFTINGLTKKIVEYYSNHKEKV